MGQDGVRQDGAAPYPDDRTTWRISRPYQVASVALARFFTTRSWTSHHRPERKQEHLPAVFHTPDLRFLLQPKDLSTLDTPPRLLPHLHTATPLYPPGLWPQALSWIRHAKRTAGEVRLLRDNPFSGSPSHRQQLLSRSHAPQVNARALLRCHLMCLKFDVISQQKL
ncbi:hypothetical protein BS78_04G294200 [Paspalum vaginatum]|nr:hypothetical protein BS78_04G294200 [Paspalum vaginatum]